MQKFAYQMRKEKEENDSNLDEETKKFEEKHDIERIFKPEHHDKLVISIVDTGIGIKKKDRRRLFKLFGTL